MKKIIAITLLMAMTISLHAQNAATARKILGRTAAVISSKGGATANFTITGTKTGTVNGSLAIKGRMFHAVTPQSIIWYNGKTQWTYLKANEEVNVSTPNEAKQMSMNPYRFINMYQSGYNLSMTDKGKGYWVHLTAQNKQRSVQEVYILINKKNYHPSTIKMRHGNSWSTITVKNLKTGKLPNSLFTFNAKDYPHAEVVDLR
ncbi:MAG: LolA-like putative outer membrane lipoprotein chaperone [Prevotella sp.]|nr:outer-membrane lipoprotein carrier protein LolA [Prevotella sp.]MDD7605539.1 LolA-like putative outer membrane lipoprotein chaperone [Prevotellaceae bacterium]MDY3248490.1 LolA-like putative outer membrane lipoprotein chaperone [Prevotella sp.]